MNDPQLTAVLERAVDALSPRDPDPVAAVLRRVRARRRRILATTCAAVVVVAGAGVAGALGTGLGTRLTGPPASDGGPTRTVADWDGETVSVGGVTVPVPGGWRAWTPKAMPRGADCSGTQYDAADHTVYVLPTAYRTPKDPTYVCENRKAAYVTVVPDRYGIGGTGDEVQLDPSGQPVWTTTYVERYRLTSMSFPWSSVSVNVYGMDREEADAFLAGVRADPAGPASGITPPSDTLSAGFVDLPAPGSSDMARNFPSWGRDLDEKLAALIEGEPGELTCVPSPGAVSTAYFNRGSDAPDGGNGQPGVALTFDRSGACSQAFDPTGGLVELDGMALHKLLKAHSLNEPILDSPSDPESSRPPLPREVDRDVDGQE